jgi:hypothetical protein
VVWTTNCGYSPLNAKKAELHKVIRLSWVGYRGTMGRYKGIWQMSWLEYRKTLDKSQVKSQRSEGFEALT